MAPNPVFTPLIRQLGPLVQALTHAKDALYRPPRTGITGLDDQTLFPAPLQPILPMGPVGSGPLAWPFEWGTNLQYTPRGDAEYSAAQLRTLAKYPLARICIENTKDMICRMPHRVQLKPRPGETSKQRAQRSKADANLGKLNAFIDQPNPRQNWSEFLRPLLEDMLTIDAASVFLARNGGGKVVELWGVDGASITCLVEEHGIRPSPPSPAYQQLWQGYPRIDLTSDQLLYKPRNICPGNTQASWLYGRAPTEQVAKEIEIGIERLRFVYDFYAQGSIPGMIHFVPPGVGPDKIKEAQQYLDATYGGNLAARRKMQLVQGWQTDGKTEQTLIPKEPALADLFDDMHIRKICFAYGTSPQRLQRMINRSSAQSQQESAEEEGTLPWMDWLKSLMDEIIQRVLGFSEYEFAFDPFHELDKLKQSQSDVLDVDNGLYTVNEIRERRGDDPRPEPEADVLNVKTTMGFIPLGSVAQTGGTNNGATIGKPSQTKKPAAQDRGSTAGPRKSNGHSDFATCEKHQHSYPRSFCRACVEAELARLQPTGSTEECVTT